MLSLIQNENMKIYRRLRTWIMFALLIGVVILASVIMNNVNDKLYSGDDSWKKDLSSRIENNKKALESGGMPKSAIDQIEHDIKIDEYALEHDIRPVSGTVWGAVQNLAHAIPLITIFTVIVAGDIVAGEFSTGTIKLLLIRPASRSKILLSKYISSFLFALFLLVTLFLSAFIVNGILLGFSGVDLPYLSVGSNGDVVEGSLLSHVLGTYGLACVELIMIVTLAFMISSVFRSSSLSIGLSIFIMYAGTILVQLLAKYSWVKYILFANTNLSQYLEGTPLVEGMTMQFSVTVLLVYFIVFNVLSWTIFTKRDVAA